MILRRLSKWFWLDHKVLEEEVLIDSLIDEKGLICGLGNILRHFIGPRFIHASLLIGLRLHLVDAGSI
jgi:hypothetical protein